MCLGITPRRSSVVHANARTSVFARRLMVERVAAGFTVRDGIGRDVQDHGFRDDTRGLDH